MRRLVVGFSAVQFALISCGGGGGGTATGPVALYFTDDASVYPSINVKVYEVNLCSDNQCQQRVNLFSNQSGLNLDLAKLNGILQYINTANIPQGTYNRLEVVMDKSLTITDNNSQQHDAVFVNWNSNNPNKPNTVQCPPSENRCYIRFNGTVQPFSQGKLVVDFVLKEFEVNTNTDPWQVTEVKMKPLTPQEASGKDMKVYLKVQSVSGNSFTGTYMGKTYTVNCGNLTCNFNVGDCVEVKSVEDPATTTTLTAKEVELENPGKCI